MNRKLAWSFCLMTVALCATAARADFLYSNLGTGTDVYNCCSGWTVSGTGTLGISFIAANQFQVTQSGFAREIDVAVSYVTGVNSFYLNIDADNGGRPGAVLASFTNLSSATSFGSCCGLVSIFDVSGLYFQTGIDYWVVIGPMDTTSTTWEAWNLSNSAQGLDDYSTDGGLSWVSNGTQPQGAFQILPAYCCGTPEPSALWLFSSGMVAALSVARRLRRR